MMITIRLADAPAGTELLAVHDGLPEGLSPAASEFGWREALAQLAALVEERGQSSHPPSWRCCFLFHGSEFTAAVRG
ncbi:MAG: hypothetical protein JWR63_2295 [Conexibacter sp.]|nr:hypothetical protein [Conexibacter sp.]